MTTFTVLHDLKPTFGIVASGDTIFEAVAEGTTESKSDEEICELGFRATNSIDAPWHEVAAAFGISKAKRSRSTSVGDAVRITDAHGSRYFLCESVGWSEMTGKPMIAAELSE